MRRYPRAAPTRPTVVRSGSVGSALAVVLLAALLLIGLVLAVRWAAGALGLAGLVGLALFEIAVAGSMWLDWREARLEIASAGRAWIVAHATLVTRIARRARWYAGGIRMLIPPRRTGAPTLELSPPAAVEHEETRAA